MENDHKLTKREREEIKKIERKTLEATLKRRNTIKKLLMWIGTPVIVILVIFGFFKLANTPQKPANIPPVSANDIKLGNNNSKTILIEYSDFECPACAQYHTMIKQLLDEMDDKILYVYRFFPLPQHQTSNPAARAGYAAYKQGKFKEMQDLLFANQAKWAEQKNVDEIFTKYAESINLDLTKFKADYNSDEAKQKIEGDLKGGESEIVATPTFFLNGIRIENPGSYEELKRLISEQIDKSN
ncbi:MAG: DsbA family protein [Patescibacteria group bacterium]|nr:DsbA family protein [Patescibacteria group bacterium]